MSTATVIAFGDQTRARCPHCKVIIGTGRRADCKRCKRAYRRLPDGTYKEMRSK